MIVVEATPYPYVPALAVTTKKGVRSTLRSFAGSGIPCAYPVRSGHTSSWSHAVSISTSSLGVLAVVLASI
jgi:hypothetical protein